MKWSLSDLLSFFFLLLKQELGWITVGLQRTLLAEDMHGAAIHTLCTTARCRLSSYFHTVALFANMTMIGAKPNCREGYI